MSREFQARFLLKQTIECHKDDRDQQDCSIQLMMSTFNVNESRQTNICKCEYPSLG